MTEARDGAQRAAAFFRHNGLDRLASEARDRVRRNGGTIGRIRLADATEAERAGFASLTGRNVGRGPLSVDLARLDTYLRGSGLACSLEEMLTAYFGERIGYLRDEKAMAVQERSDLRGRWRALLEEIEHELPPDSKGRAWLATGGHGIEWLVKQLNDDDLRQPGPIEEKQGMVRAVAVALCRLSVADPVRLAVLANELTGDPHRFDPQQEAGRLLLRALADIYGAELGLDPAADRIATGERRSLYGRAGIIAETLVSIVTAFNLAGARRTNGDADPAAAKNAYPCLVLPLRHLLTWQSACPTGSAVFLVENPTVFESIVEQAESETDSRDSWPTVICTSGWFNGAVWRLLSLLIAGDSHCRFHYSGDFDLAGLRIAASLKRAHPDRFIPWRLDAASYELGARIGGKPAANRDMELLSSLQQTFPDLVEAIQEAGRWSYQESLTSLLMEDLHRAAPDLTSHPIEP